MVLGAKWRGRGRQLKDCGDRRAPPATEGEFLRLGVWEARRRRSAEPAGRGANPALPWRLLLKIDSRFPARWRSHAVWAASSAAARALPAFRSHVSLAAERAFRGHPNSHPSARRPQAGFTSTPAFVTRGWSLVLPPTYSPRTEGGFVSRSC